MGGIVLAAGWITIGLLYVTSLKEERTRLSEMVEYQNAMVTGVAPDGETRALKHFKDTYSEYYKSGPKCEFVLAKLEDGKIKFLDWRRTASDPEVLNLSLSNNLAVPARLALSGKSGTIIGLDYRGNFVLAAYRPADMFGWGIVAKINFIDIQAPYIMAALAAVASAAILVLLGGIFFLRFTNPIFQLLYESERNFSFLIKGIKDYAIFMLDPGGRVATWNPGAERIMGYSGKEIIGRHISCFYTEEDALSNKPENDLYSAVNEGRFEDEGWRVRKDGNKFWANGVINSLYDRKGRVKGFAKIMRDITEKKQSEEVLHESEERFRLIFEQSPMGANIISTDYKILRVNNRFCAFLGYSWQEMINKPVQSFTHPDDAKKDEWNTGRLLKGDLDIYVTDKRYIRKDGSIFWGHLTVSLMKNPAGDPLYFLGLIEDIAEIKKAEEALHESEARFKLVFDRSPIGCAIVTMDYRYELVNEAFREFLGYSDTEFASLKLSDVTHPGDLDIDLGIAKSLMNGEAERAVRDKRYIRKDRKVVWGHISVNLMRDHEGKPRNFLVLVEDITERKKAEEALRESLDRFRTVSEMTTEWAAAVDIMPGGNKKTIWRFGAYEKLTGYSSADLDRIGGIEEIIYREDRDIYRNSINKIIDGQDVTPEFRIVTKNGELTWMQFFWKPVQEYKNEGIVRFISAGKDITGRKKDEERILSSLREKEALLRELYHRTKNNMQVISALLQLYSSKTTDDSVRAAFREMVDRIQSMALVHQKLYQSKSLSSIDLSDYIADLSNLLISSYSPGPEKISLLINAEKIQIQIDVAVPCGLILNELISNSLKHAFPGDRKGEIRINLHKTGNDIIELSVADNGVGVPEGFDFRKSEKMGVQSVFAIAEHQLRGDVSFESHNGIVCTLHFNREYGIGMD